MPLPPDFIESMMPQIFTAENVARATEYLAGRAISASQLRLPWAMSGPDTRPFEFTRRWGRYPREYIDRLYIPVVDMRFDPEVTGAAVLAGYDMRYCGDRPDPVKYTKIKRDEHTPVLYNVHEALGVGGLKNTWTLLVESAINAETLRALNLPVVSPLTANGTPSFAVLLYGLFERVYIMYDNDDGGRAGRDRLIRAARDVSPKVAESFQSIVYSGNDVNDSVRDLGYPQLLRSIAMQVPEARSRLGL